jgi:hypothetical protein
MVPIPGIAQLKLSTFLLRKAATNSESELNGEDLLTAKIMGAVVMRPSDTSTVSIPPCK